MKHLLWIGVLLVTLQGVGQDTIHTETGYIVGKKENGRKVGTWKEYKGRIRIKTWQYGDGDGFLTKTTYPFTQGDRTIETYRISRDTVVQSGPYSYYLNNSLQEYGNYLDGYPVGEWVTYYPNSSSVLERTNYGSEYMNVYYMVEYYQNGKVMQEGNVLVSHGKIGKWKEYYKSGALRSVGVHFPITSKEMVEEQNGEMTMKYAKYTYQKDGRWQYFSEDGKLIKEETYKEGKPIDN